MKLGRLRSSEWLAGIGGAGVVALMFAPLYGGGAAGERFTRSGWEALTVMPVVATIAGLFGVALFVFAAAQRTAAVAVALGGLATTVVGIALIFVVVRVVWLPELDPPAGVAAGDTEREPWLWGAFACSIALLVGAWRGLGDNSFARGSTTDPALRAAGSPRVLPAPPGAAGPAGDDA